MARKIIQAHSLSVGRCDDCEAMHVYFHNEDGDVVAEAVVGGAELVGYTNDVVEICEDLFGTPKDDIGECLGSA